MNSLEFKEAEECLDKIVYYYAKSFHDIEELKSIGLEVIAKIFRLKKQRKIKNVKSWKGFLCISLCNAFKNYIKRENKKGQIYDTKTRKLSINKEEDIRIKLKEVFVVLDGEDVFLELPVCGDRFLVKTNLKIDDFKNLLKGGIDG